MASLSSPWFATPVVASPYHEFDGQKNDTGNQWFPIDTNVRAAQSFTPSANFTLTRIGMFVRDSGRDDALSITLAPDFSGRPHPTQILAGTANNTADVFEWANFTLTPSVPVTIGTRYWIVADDSAGNGEGYEWRYLASDLYAGGNASTAVGGTWTAEPGDLAFVLYGWTPSAVTMAVSADRPTVAGGDPLRVTIRFTNTGTEDATNVWVNATLEPHLRFVNGVPGPVAVSRSLVTFRPAMIPNGTSEVLLDLAPQSILQDDVSLIVPVTAEFFDGTMPRYIAGAASVRTRAPTLTASLAILETGVEPGSVVTFAVMLTNQGTAAARHVWLNESLNSALTYLSDTAPVPVDQDGPRQSWHLMDVVPGVTRFNVSVQIDPRTYTETIITNFFSIENTDSAGTGLTRGKSNTVWLTVAGAGSPSNPWLWGSFVISATLVGGTYVGIAKRRLRTEEIFLIHHSGVLLVHMSKSIKADHDSDIVSGMLTAILNFVRDAFHYDERQELQGLDLGQYRVHLRKGGITYLALVHTGKSTRWLARAASMAVQDLESQHGEMLRTWDGDLRTIAGVRDILKGYFLSPTGPSRSWAWFRRMFARVDQTFKPMRPL